MRISLLLLFIGILNQVWGLPEIAISGQITDRQGRPLPSIVVKLLAAGLTDTTDLEGMFNLASSSEPTTRLLTPKQYIHNPSSALYSANGKTIASSPIWNLPRQAYYNTNSSNNIILSRNSQPYLHNDAADNLELSQNGTILTVLPLISYTANLGALAVNPHTTFTDDRDGRIYRYVEIGGQYWMADNLNYGVKVNATSEMKLDDVVEKYCVGDDTLNCARWGGLYKWAEAMALPNNCNQYSCTNKISATGHQGICPDGWNIPTPRDWRYLVTNVNADSTTISPLLRNDTGWAQNQNGTNTSGFNALPVGNRNAKSQYVNNSTHAYWWTASELDHEYGEMQFLWGSKEGLYTSTSLKNDNGFSIRCFRGPQSGGGSISWERWDGTYTLSTIPLSTPPTATGTWSSFEAPLNIGDNYGYRVRGYLSPPQNGYYTFWIAADNQAKLYLSTNTAEANSVEIASVTDWTASREWNKYSVQKSIPIYLGGMSRYYIEVRMVEGAGFDNLAVGWSKPGEPTLQPSEVIPGSALTSW